MAREMKDSGIRWIGDIPLSWIVASLKYLLTEEADNIKVGPFGSQLSGNDFVEDGYWVYNQRTVMDNNFDYNDTCISKEKYNLMNGFQVRENDILITTRGTIGRICRIPSNYHRGIIHPCIIKFRVDENKILYSLLELIFNHSDIIKTQLSYKSNATTIDVIYGETLKNLILPLPPLNEQRKIADFLEKKCAEIDALSSDIQSQIDILEDYKKFVITEAVTKGLNPDVEMKDSHNSYLGKVPSHWREKRLRFLGICQNGISKSSEFFGEGYPFVSYGDVYKNYVLPLNGSGLIKSNRSDRNIYSVRYGDVFFTRTSETIEEIGFASTCLKTIDNAAFAGFLIRFRPYGQEELLPEFSKYYFRSDIHRKFFVKEMNLVTRASLSQELLKRLPVLLPPIEEQKSISDYLDQKCAEVDAAISEKGEQLEVLEQYKKSLIYEYVTGKKEVPENNG